MRPCIALFVLPGGALRFALQATLTTVVALGAQACVSPPVDGPTASSDETGLASASCGGGAGTADELGTGGMAWTMVEVASDEFDELTVVLTWPTEGNTAWADGAPVAVMVPPAFNTNGSWGREGFSPGISAAGGMAEVSVVLPGMNVEGHTTSGPFDYGGESSVTAVREAVRFATGELLDTEGRSVRELSGVPVCNDQVVLSSRSAGGLVSARAMARDADILGDLVIGLVAHEPPSLPSFVGPEVGAVWMDPDITSDDNGNGLAWDEGRNASLREDDCDESSCPTDLSTLSWSDDVAIDQLFDSESVHSPPGVFYLDRDGSGVLDLLDGHPDLDGNGVIDIDEDTVLPPLQIRIGGGGSSQRHAYSPRVIAAAQEGGLFDASGWPSHVDDPAINSEFWSTRHMVRSTASAAESREWGFGLVYREVPHAASLRHRSGVRLVYDAAFARGNHVRYNAPDNVVRCILGDSGPDDWNGGPGSEAEVDPRDMAEAAFPASVSLQDAMTLGVAAMLWDMVGPLDDCR